MENWEKPAGRSKEKLKHLRNEMIAINSFMGRVSILYANAFDTEELDRITSKTRCLLNFAGPYTWYGSQVVESCVRNMCHYVDLSLELPWVMKMIGKHQAKAVKNKTRYSFEFEIFYKPSSSYDAKLTTCYQKPIFFIENMYKVQFKVTENRFAVLWMSVFDFFFQLEIVITFYINFWCIGAKRCLF